MSSTSPPQTFANHAKLVPGFHYVGTLFVLIFTLWAFAQLFRAPGFGSIAMASAAVALNIIGFYARGFATQNQDRIIRLEERLRMRELLPADLHARINDLTTSQMVALRFASDGELADLTRRVLDEGVQDRKAIKQMIQDWRADHHRV